MPISHLCPACGADLARVRAQREPHYGLPLVTCPRCSGASVRRRHPLQRTWRALLRLGVALTVMVINLKALLLLAGLTTAFIQWIVMENGDRSWTALWDRLWFPITAGLFLLPVATGTWLRLGLSHWNRVAAWLAFTGLIVVGITASTIVYALAIALQLGRQGAAGGGFAAAIDLPEAAGIWLRGICLLYLMMLLATAGLVPGAALHRLLGTMRSAIWRWRRRRGRRERMA